MSSKTQKNQESQAARTIDSTETLPPLVFLPILKPKVWGGRRLLRFGKDLPPNQKIGESWEIADLPRPIVDGRSFIAGGPLCGRTLHDALSKWKHAIMGQVALSDEGGFPLLIKFLDARENLSVQVHPDEAYAAAHPDTHLKSEAWVVLEADEGSTIYKGLTAGTDSKKLRHAIDTKTVPDLLTAIEAKPGDCHYLPSGTCHALGAGVLVAEIQTPSDTTFRVYDWGRTDRTLHVEAALQCIDFSDHTSTPASATEFLCETPYFRIRKCKSRSGLTEFVQTEDAPLIWIVISGSGMLQSEQTEEIEFSAGSTVLLPASLRPTDVRFDTETVVIVVDFPPTTD